MTYVLSVSTLIIAMCITGWRHKRLRNLVMIIRPEYNLRRGR